MTGLAEHNARVRYDLEALGLNAPTWVEPREGVYDVVIVGGGQSGMGAAFALRKERVTNVLILDENEKGLEGPWVTYARMITLRTPKDLLSIDCGIPSLTFREYWVAQHGEEGWDSIDKIPRKDWMGYLRWYRDILDLPVQNESKVTKITPTGGGIHELNVTTPSGPQTIKARKVILATGIQGGGEWHTPDFIKDALPKSRYAHTSEAIDYEALKGKRVGILGGGASAFDNAQHALSLGVDTVDVFMRRKKMPRINPIRFMEKTGVVPRFAALDDARKYEVISHFITMNQPPTNDTFQRAAAYPGFGLHLGSPWEAVRDTGTGVEVTTPKGTLTYDFVVLSTGMLTDVELRPELSEVADSIARWGDVFDAPEAIRNRLLDLHPYLGDGFEFTPRTPEDAADVHGLFAFNYSTLVSLGLSASALTGLPYALPRLAKAVADQLFLDDKGAWLEAYLGYNDEEFVSEWTPDEKVRA
ncbi:NAD(P)/FAD-dependent oxidoreductase [Henriciella sp. AS95]|uniref:NAD(P)/FAD-dependent oxidoreductase n=1 Tax=Henriciella sp. AS95 TaxID=3135782 RepID=UPI00317ED12A